MQPNLIRHQFNGLGKETIGAMKLHQHFEFGPASQDPFSFCQIQLALDTVCMTLPQKRISKFFTKFSTYRKGEVIQE